MDSRNRYSGRVFGQRRNVLLAAILVAIVTLGVLYVQTPSFMDTNMVLIRSDLFCGKCASVGIPNPVADAVQLDDTWPKCKNGGWTSSSTGDEQTEDPWKDMKRIPRPARCLVKGKWAIEELEPEMNFRRAYALGFVQDVEDKRQLLPWLMAAQDISLHTRKRRVLLDLGANAFQTSVYWMLRTYPLDFTEIHAFERTANLFRIPDATGSSFITREMDNASRFVPAGWKRLPLDLPPWVLSRITTHNKFVGDADNEASGQVNITRFILEDLRLTEDDALIIKMDIEGAEWPILNRWAMDRRMPQIVDELFVEIHYKSPSMAKFGWVRNHGHTREEATELLVKLRDAGIAVHAWP